MSNEAPKENAVCGVDCYQGDDLCNHYCVGEAAQPPQIEAWYWGAPTVPDADKWALWLSEFNPKEEYLAVQIAEAMEHHADALVAAERDRLTEASDELCSIVEGIQGAFNHGAWRDEKNGMRLKDTGEWVRFYNVIRARARTDADAQAALEAVKREAYRQGYSDAETEISQTDLGQKVEYLSNQLTKVISSLREARNEALREAAAMIDDENKQSWEHWGEDKNVRVAQTVAKEIQDAILALIEGDQTDE